MRNISPVVLASLLFLVPATALSAQKGPARVGKTAKTTKVSRFARAGAQIALLASGTALLAGGVYSLVHADGSTALPQLAAGFNLVRTGLRRPTNANLAQGAVTTTLATMGAGFAQIGLNEVFAGDVSNLQGAASMAKVWAGSALAAASTAANNMVNPNAKSEKR